MGQSQLLQPLGVVEQLLEVCPDWVVGQVQGQEGAQTHEDVVGQDGQPVVGQGERDELESVGEHGGVEVLDLVEGEVEIPQCL